MGDIGPYRAQYDVLPVPEFGLEDADDWTVPGHPLPLGAGPHSGDPDGAFVRGSGADPVR